MSWLVIFLWLEVTRLPPVVPRNLAMRPAAAAPAPAKTEALYSPLPVDLDDLERRVVVKAQLGYMIDQGRPLEGQDFPLEVQQTRLAYFGDLVLGSNGLLRPSLATYLAANFFLDQSGAAQFQALPTVYDAFPDRQALLIRAGWAQLDGALGGRLKPLWVRAGRQFRYGAAIAHFDGLAVGWDGDSVRASLFAGRRVALYSLADRFGLGGDPGAIAGATLRLRLRKLFELPLAIGADVLRFGDEDHVAMAIELDTPGKASGGARVRVANGALAEIRGNARLRASPTTTLHLDVQERLAGDWTYDYVLSQDDTTGAADKRLRLGPPIPRLRAGLRAGTVLFENWDVGIEGAFVWEHRRGEESSFQPTYLELGAGVEATFLGGLSAGVEARMRRFYRELAANVPLMDTGALGEIASREGMARLRYSLGVRRFTAEAIAYVRSMEVERLVGTGETFVLAGGRFRLEGWFTRRLRLVGEYELAGEPGDGAERFLNIRGLQTLRVLAEATF